MVGVAQLVEPRVVISAVVGSSPIVHPIFRFVRRLGSLCSVALLGGCTLNQPPGSTEIPRLFVAGDSTAARYAGARIRSKVGASSSVAISQPQRLRVVNEALGRPQQPHVHQRRPLGANA